MIRREAQFQTLFRHWLRANPRYTAAFELKQTQTNSISFSAVEEHQIMALLAARNSIGLLYKIPDDSRGVKPFDMIYLREVFAYVVIKYPNCFVIIDVVVFQGEKERSEKKSLTVERAKEIALEVVELRKPH